MSEEFYVGYQPHQPSRLGRFVQNLAIGILIVTVAVCLTLIFAQMPFDRSQFEYGKDRSYSGTLSASPTPFLDTLESSFILVAPGKHGFQSGLLHSGLTVEVSGSLIQRDDLKMLEVHQESVRPTKARSDRIVSSTSLGEHEFVGEIVDSKCYLGVMNPGRGKVHRDCAVRCISGGVPPALRVKDANGNVKVMLLTGDNLAKGLLAYVAEPVRVRGALTQRGQMLLLKTDLHNVSRE